MPYRPRELAVRAREAAGLLLSTLDRGEIVQRFLDMYAAEYRRPGRADQPGHYREQLDTIRREAILAMVIRTEGLLPKRLKVRVSLHPAKKRKRLKKGKHRVKRLKVSSLDLAIPLLDLFREEFFVALGQALNWSEEDAQDFWRDLDLYESLTAVDEHRSKPHRHSAAPVSGPFVDRVALLLDPSLMEQARRAAGKFQIEINSITDRVLRRVFSRRRAN
ncbi:MAG TPA: hypothetical protein VJR23_16570 [Candidatus Acidoferrales bacterium]|nr:hypothetical protein [Candidatus Acidoferrales bacterium]